MPVLDTERGTAGRSALRYRPLSTGQTAASPVVLRTRRSRPDARATTAPATPDDRDLEEEERISRRRPGASVPLRPAPPVRTRRHIHPLLFVGLGLLLTILLWIGITQAINWGTNELNTLKYGDPRTFQVDAVVGQGDSPQHPSHFVALNLQGVVTIIEFPAGDPSRVRTLASTTVPGPNADQAVVTLRFIDRNHGGQPDMFVDINGTQSILINDRGTFRPPTTAEQQQFFLYLQQHP